MTDLLKRIYSANENIRVYDALVLHHPNFSQPYRYLVNDTKAHDFAPEVGGTTVMFEPMPFLVTLPKAGEVQQELEIVLPNIGTDLLSEIESALNTPDVPITLGFRVYVDGDPDPQAQIDDLHFTSLSADTWTVTGKAKRTDLFSRYILDTTLYGWNFEGLWL